MIKKITQAIWGISFLTAVVAIFFVYASLPEHVHLLPQHPMTISKSLFYYFTIVLFALFNGLFFSVDSLFIYRSMFFNAWIIGLIAIFNFFLVVVIELINRINSLEKYAYSHIGFIIYISLGLLIAWAVTLPIYQLIKLFQNKKSIA